jgi:hypothetical protein
VGVESFKEAGLRGDKTCVVSHEMGVEKSGIMACGFYVMRVSHRTGVENFILLKLHVWSFPWNGC